MLKPPFFLTSSNWSIPTSKGTGDISRFFAPTSYMRRFTYYIKASSFLTDKGKLGILKYSMSSSDLFWRLILSYVALILKQSSKFAGSPSSSSSSLACYFYLRFYLCCKVFCVLNPWLAYSKSWVFCLFLGAVYIDELDLTLFVGFTSSNLCLVLPSLTPLCDSFSSSSSLSSSYCCCYAWDCLLCYSICLSFCCLIRRSFLAFCSSSSSE